MFEFIKRRQQEKELKNYQQSLPKASNEELLKNFRTENWENLSNEKRLAVVQEVENRNAKEQGRTPCEVKLCESSSYGCYSPSSNEIQLHVESSFYNDNGEKIENNSYEVLDTVYHEGEHAHQTNCVKNQIDPPRGLPKETRDMCELEDKYYVYSRTIDYSNCTCEVDSNNVAAQKVMENGKLFCNDPEYSKYLDKREKEMETLAKADMATVRRQQSAALDQAYDRGDISASKYNEIKADIYNNKSQPAFEQAKQVQAQINDEKTNCLAPSAAEMKEHYQKAGEYYTAAVNATDTRTREEYQRKGDEEAAKGYQAYEKTGVELYNKYGNEFKQTEEKAYQALEKGDKKSHDAYMQQCNRIEDDWSKAQKAVRDVHDEYSRDAGRKMDGLERIRYS